MEKIRTFPLQWKICLPLIISYSVLYSAGFDKVFPIEQSRETLPERVVIQEAAVPSETEASAGTQKTALEMNAELLASQWVDTEEHALTAATKLKERGIGSIKEITTLSTEQGAAFVEKGEEAPAYEDAVIYLLLITDTDGSDFLVRLDRLGAVASVQAIENDYN